VIFSEFYTRIWFRILLPKRKREWERALRDALTMTQTKQDLEIKVKEMRVAASASG